MRPAGGRLPGPGCTPGRRNGCRARWAARRAALGRRSWAEGRPTGAVGGWPAPGGRRWAASRRRCRPPGVSRSTARRVRDRGPPPAGDLAGPPGPPLAPPPGPRRNGARKPPARREADRGAPPGREGAAGAARPAGERGVLLAGAAFFAGSRLAFGSRRSFFAATAAPAPAARTPPVHSAGPGPAHAATPETTVVAAAPPAAMTCPRGTARVGAVAGGATFGAAGGLVGADLSGAGDGVVMRRPS